MRTYFRMRGGGSGLMVLGVWILLFILALVTEPAVAILLVFYVASLMGITWLSNKLHKRRQR